MPVQVGKQMINKIIDNNFTRAVSSLGKSQRHYNTNTAMFMTLEINVSSDMNFKGWTLYINVTTF